MLKVRHEGGNTIVVQNENFTLTITEKDDGVHVSFDSDSPTIEALTDDETDIMGETVIIADSDDDDDDDMDDDDRPYSPRWRSRRQRREEYAYDLDEF